MAGIDHDGWCSVSADVVAARTAAAKQKERRPKRGHHYQGTLVARGLMRRFDNFGTALRPLMRQFPPSRNHCVLAVGVVKNAGAMSFRAR